jgi:phenylalanyl-tRNA synthetase beta chain
MDAVVAHAVEVPRFRDLTSFPAVRQDLAVVLGDDRTAAEALTVIDEAGGELLRSAELFDVYRGPQVGEGRYSVAIALTFQAEDRTLTQEDVAPAHARIVEALASIGGELRS